MVTANQNSCRLITDENSMSVKTKLHFDIITRLSHTAQPRQLSHDESKDVLKASSHS